jgi:HlyD family secretion protein
MFKKIDQQVRRIVNEPDLLLDADAIDERKIAPSLSYILYLFLSFLLVAIIWSSLAKIDEVIVAKGRLVSVEPTVVLQPLETSIIKSLNVHVGQEVAKDELLAELDPTLVGADYESAKERLESLDAQLTRIESELSGKPLLASKTQHMQMQIGITNDKLAAYQSKIKSLELSLERAKESKLLLERAERNLASKFDSATEAESMSSRLVAAGFISRKEYLDASDRKLDAEKELITVQNQLSESQSRFLSLQQELLTFKREFSKTQREEQVSVRRERDALVQEVRKVNLRNGLLEVRAPMDSVVLDIASRSVGSVLSQASTFITLAPKSSTLNVHAYIKPSDINQINVGDFAKVKIDAYPFQKYGLINGRILRITRDAVRPDFRGVPADKDYFVAVLALEPVVNNQHNLKMQLLPGMTLNCEVVIGQSTIISYIINPIIKIKDESLSEKK